MKIIHVLNYFLPDRNAGTEVYAWALCKHLHQQGINVKVLVPNYFSERSEMAVFDKIEVYKYAEPSIPDRALILGQRKADGIPFFLDILRQEQPDVVHFHELAGSNGITLHHVIAARELGCKIIFTCHLSNYSCKASTLMFKGKTLCNGIIDISKCTLCNYSIKSDSKVLSALFFPLSMLAYNLNINTINFKNKVGTALAFPFLIEKLRRDLIKLGENVDKIVVLTKWYENILIKNNIPQHKIKLITQALPKPVKTQHPKKESSLLKVLFIGRISHFKGLHLLLEAYKNLNTNKISLDIYGKDNPGEMEYMNDCKHKASLLANVFWRGEASSETLMNLIGSYDLLCLPSTFSEMSPLVIQEAYAAGVPVLASNVYGNAEQIKDGVNGMLFFFNDVNDLTKKIQTVLDAPHILEEFKKALPLVKEFNEVADEYDNLYKEILQN